MIKNLNNDLYSQNNPFSEIGFGETGIEVGQVKDSTIDLLSIYNDYGATLNFFGALIIVTAMVAMIYRFFVLSRSGDKEQARRRAIRGVLTTGVGLIALGSFMLIANLVFNVFS